MGTEHKCQWCGKEFEPTCHPETLADPKAAEPDLEQIVYKRKKQAGKRELDFSKLPTEQIVHELPEGEQVCPVCGGEMHACGHEVVRRELRYVPAQYKVVEHVQTAYSCRNCEKNALATPMKKSEVPAGLIPGSGIVSPSLLAHILNNKVCLWRGADLCCETERVADARVPGRSLGIIQQPC